MAAVDGISDSNLVKRIVFLALDDVLVGGAVVPQINGADVKTVLQFFEKLSKQVAGFHFFAVSGYQREITFKKISDAKLDSFFPPNRVLFVTDAYLDSKEEIDRQIYGKALAENPMFKDEYFKQKAIEQTLRELNISAEQAVLIGHDLFFDAFYSQRFSKIDFVLVKKALSNRDKPQEKIIRGINYIQFAWPDIRKVLLGKLPPTDVYPLRNMVQFQLQQELVSPMAVEKIAQARAEQLKQKQENEKTDSEKPLGDGAQLLP